MAVNACKDSVHNASTRALLDLQYSQHMMCTNLSLEQELEDVPAQWQGHDLSVEETESNETSNVTICIEPLGGVVGHSRGVESHFARLVEQRGVQWRGGASEGVQIRAKFDGFFLTITNFKSKHIIKKAFQIAIERMF